jgi:hypothetical protein
VSRALAVSGVADRFMGTRSVIASRLDVPAKHSRTESMLARI